jgi:hypothetical protein
MFGRTGQVGADRADAEQAEGLAAQDTGIGTLPFASLLGLDPFQHPFFEKKQVAENIFGHQRAEDATSVGQHIVAAQGRVQQGLDARVNGLDPLRLGKTRQRIPDGFRLAEDDVCQCFVADNFQFWEIGFSIWSRYSCESRERMISFGMAGIISVECSVTGVDLADSGAIKE